MSACYGDYDKPYKPPLQNTDHEVEFVMVGDGLNPWDGWTNVTEPRPHLHNNVAAKFAKMRPDLYSDADYLIWVDAGCTFDTLLVERLVGNPWIMFRHAVRKSIIAEAAESKTQPKYGPFDILRQAHHYVDSGYPDQNLFSTALIGRERSALNQAVGDAWLREIIRWTFQDQISFPYVAWQHGLEINELDNRGRWPVNARHTWFRYTLHQGPQHIGNWPRSQS